MRQSRTLVRSAAIERFRVVDLEHGVCHRYLPPAVKLVAGFGLGLTVDEFGIDKLVGPFVGMAQINLDVPVLGKRPHMRYVQPLADNKLARLAGVAIGGFGRKGTWRRWLRWQTSVLRRYVCLALILWRKWAHRHGRRRQSTVLWRLVGLAQILWCKGADRNWRRRQTAVFRLADGLVLVAIPVPVSVPVSGICGSEIIRDSLARRFASRRLGFMQREIPGGHRAQRAEAKQQQRCGAQPHDEGRFRLVLRAFAPLLRALGRFGVRRRCRRWCVFRRLRRDVLRGGCRRGRHGLCVRRFGRPLRRRNDERQTAARALDLFSG